MKGKTSKFLRDAAILAVAVLLLTIGCGKSYDSGTNPGGGYNPPGNSPSNLVVINNFAFSPQSATISAGDTVTWRNDQNVGHTVTSNSGGELNSPVLGQGQTYVHVFNSVGTYAYHCTPHPTMTGSVIVQ